MEAYPKPRVPPYSVLSLATLGGRRARYPSVLDCGEGKLVTSGRMAIALALRHMRVGPGDKVLVPAFHCLTMVEPVVWVGATPVFYRIFEDTRVDLANIRSKLDPAVKALLVTHYFGFPQDAPQARALCDGAGIALIEDCAHAFFGVFAGRPPGWYGDYAIASVMKFFPVYDGGLLVSSRKDVAGVHTARAGAAFQLKALINALERAFGYGRLPALKVLLALPLWLKDLVWGTAKSISPGQRPRVEIGPAASSGGYEFDAAWLEQRMTWSSKWIMRLASSRRIVEARRRNYLTLLEALGGLPGARPLFPVLPEGVVPYVFPLLVEHPERVFPELKRLGVPILRWEAPTVDLDPEEYPVGTAFYRKLLQFPCHEAVTPAELDWMIEQIARTLRAAGKPGARAPEESAPVGPAA